LGEVQIDLVSGWKGYKNPWQGNLSDAIANALKKLHYVSADSISDLRIFVRIQKNRDKVLIETHPLWTANHPQYLEAVHQIQRQYSGYDIQQLNPFRAVRRPTDYI